MMVFNKNKSFAIGNESKIYNPHSIMEFINKFYNQFEYEVASVDASANDRTFKFHLLYYKNNIQRDVIIEYSSYDAQFKYFIETKGIDELSFKMVFRDETEFIKELI